MLFERKLEKIIDDLSAHYSVPMSLRLWNGKLVKLADQEKVIVNVPNMSSLRHFIHPTLDKLGEAYVEGQIDVQGKVTDVIDVATQFVLEGEEVGVKQHGRSKRHRHTRSVDKGSISYHYDVSNEFYSQWLDQRMVYSCGYFRHENDSLDTAQEQKLDHILNKINLQPGQTLLDVGCGWGALVIRAAQKYGAKCTGITLSKAQLEEAQKRINAAGLSDCCEVKLLDYRDMSGMFDRITSVGMFEHVGLDNLPMYFNKLNSLLADNGVIMNHGITTSDPNSGCAPAGAGEFIDRYVFPNGELPHISLVLFEMANAGLEVTDIENLRIHYAKTLDHWAERFEEKSELLKTMVDDKHFRIWRVYLAGCAHAFYQNWVALHQVVATKAGSQVLPLTRDYMYK